MLAYIFVAIGCGLLAFSIGRVGKFVFRRLPYADLLIFGFIVVATIMSGVTSRVAAPAGLFFHRVDVELAVFGFGVVMLAIVFPSANDLYCFKTFPDRAGIRNEEFLSSIPFTWRRPVTAFVALLLLGVAITLLVSINASPLVTAGLLACSGIVAASVFEHAYGYRSYIMRVFAFSLFVMIAFAILLRSNYIQDVPSLLINATTTLWGAVWLMSLWKVWETTDTFHLVSQQKFWHSVYLLTFFAGHAFIFVLWIVPLLRLSP